jgi:hypothetical protein
MIDPLTALSVVSTAVSQLRQLASAGRDTSQALTKFAGAWADLNEAERRAKNPPWYKSFSGSIEREAAEAFAAKRKAEALKKELENTIRFVYGPSGLQEYKDTLRQMREQKRKNEHRKQQLQQAIIEWTLGIVIFLILIGVMGGVFYYIGVKAGRF